jgi:hypothetical protein
VPHALTLPTGGPEGLPTDVGVRGFSCMSARYGLSTWGTVASIDPVRP